MTPTSGMQQQEAQKLSQIVTCGCQPDGGSWTAWAHGIYVGLKRAAHLQELEVVCREVIWHLSRRIWQHAQRLRVTKGQLHPECQTACCQQ